MVELAKDVKYIIKVLDGNGVDGIKKKVENNTAFKNKAIGAIGFVGLVGIGNLIATLTK